MSKNDKNIFKITMQNFFLKTTFFLLMHTLTHWFNASDRATIVGRIGKWSSTTITSLTTIQLSRHSGSTKNLNWDNGRFVYNRNGGDPYEFFRSRRNAVGRSGTKRGQTPSHTTQPKFKTGRKNVREFFSNFHLSSRGSDQSAPRHTNQNFGTTNFKNLVIRCLGAKVRGANVMAQKSF